MTTAQGQADVLSLAQAKRVAAMLDIDPQQFSLGDPVPRGWHFALLAGQTLRRDLRSDGFPGLGAAMPQLERPRLMLGQRSTTYQSDLHIGLPFLRQSDVTSIVEKSGRNGPLSIVTLQHSLTPADAPTPAVTETQTYFLLGQAAAATPSAPPLAAVDLPAGGTTKLVTPDAVMLFQYSALGFNTHRIHFDRDYAREVEGHPDLVVNGGLATLLATEYLRADLRLMVNSLTARHMAPLYVNRPMTIHLQRHTGGIGKILLLDSDGIIAADLAVTFNGL